jgi:hypothetical protein
MVTHNLWINPSIPVKNYRDFEGDNEQRLNAVFPNNHIHIPA